MTLSSSKRYSMRVVWFDCFADARHARTTVILSVLSYYMSIVFFLLLYNGSTKIQRCPAHSPQPISPITSIDSTMHGQLELGAHTRSCLQRCELTVQTKAFTAKISRLPSQMRCMVAHHAEHAETSPGHFREFSLRRYGAFPLYNSPFLLP